jgi:hypothetical protein
VVRNAAIAAVESLGWARQGISGGPEDFRIRARTPENLLTYGDNVVIIILAESANSTRVDMSSTSGQAYDWGRNRENIELFFAEISGQITLAVSQSVPYGLIVTRLQDVSIGGDLPPGSETFGPGELPIAYVHGYGGETVRLRVADVASGTVHHDHTQYIPTDTDYQFPMNVPPGAYRVELSVRGVGRHDAVFSMAR